MKIKYYLCKLDLDDESKFFNFDEDELLPDVGTISIPESLLLPEDNRSITLFIFFDEDDDEEDECLNFFSSEFLPLLLDSVVSKCSLFRFFFSNRRLSSSLKLLLISFDGLRCF